MRRVLLYGLVPIGFAAIGYAASLGSASKTTPQAKTFALDGRPSAIAVHSGDVFVADDQSQAVHVLDASTGRSRRLVRVERNPIALSVGAGSLWIAHATGNVTRVPLDSAQSVRTARVGGSITDVAFAHGRLWAADLGRNELLELNAHLRVVRRVHGVGPVRLAATSDALWMTTRYDQVVRFDFRTHRLSRVHVGPGPIGLAADGASVWALNSDAGTVTRIDSKSVRVVGRPIRVGRGPVNVVVRRGVVWVSNADDQSFTKIDAKTGRVVGPPAVIGTHVRGMASDRDLWIAGTDPNEVVRLSE